MNKISALFLLLAASIVAAAGMSDVKHAMTILCDALVNILPVVAMLMVVVSAVIYAAGQIMGAETRARANVWATAALTGALISGLIYAITPSVFAYLFFGDSTEELSCIGGTIGP